ncbi:MAG: hypothetical protein QM687_09595 [Ferruginibacter sp.]
MAEQEVIKHTKKVYKIWNSKQHSFWYKLKEFFIEILIIVFAVSLSIWLHEKSEHSAHSKEAKTFLLGLKEDLTSDITEMQNDIYSYTKSGNAYHYIATVKRDEPLDAARMDSLQNFLFNETKLVPNVGRFEGFKSAGKMDFIENKVLQNKILDLYQEEIPSLIWSADYSNALKGKLKQYCWQNVKRLTDSTNNLFTVLKSDEAYNAAQDLQHSEEIIGRYRKCIKTCEEIISEINKDYNLK